MYHASPKNRNELRQCAMELNTQLMSIGRLLDTRWVASSYRTLKAVWQSFSALNSHFESASNDTRRDAKERSSYKGLMLKLTSDQFLLDMGTVLDALQELSELSLELQKRSLNIIESHRALCRQIRVFEAMVESGGTYLKEALKAAEERTFKGVRLHSATKNTPSINHKQLYRSLVDNMKHRLLVCHSSCSSSLEASILEKSAQYTSLIESAKILYPEYWLEPYDTLFGDAEISYLCSKFSINFRPALRAFRKFVENKGKQEEDDLKPLISSVEAIAVSTAERERGFSCMNLTVTDTRN